MAPHFQPESCGAGSSPLPTDFERDQQSDKGPARLAVRKITPRGLLNPYRDWPGVGQVCKLERWLNSLRNQPLRYAVVSGLTRLTRSEASRSRWLKLTRDYWGIENGLHDRRDVTWHEEATRMRNRQPAEVMAILNNRVVGLVAQPAFNNRAAARRYYAAHRADAVEVLFRQPN